jgi:hypothetical protein
MVLPKIFIFCKDEGAKMVSESNCYKLAGLLLLLTGISHISQIFIYQPTPVIKIAAVAGLIYASLGVLSFRKISWLPGLVIALCALGFTAGTNRLLNGPFSFQGLAHQLMHLLIIGLFILLIFSRRKMRGKSAE